MTMTVERTISTTAAPADVLPFLADFRNATEWDAGTVSRERVSGDGGPGTVYKNVSKFAGNTVDSSTRPRRSPRTASSSSAATSRRRATTPSRSGPPRPARRSPTGPTSSSPGWPVSSAP